MQTSSIKQLHQRTMHCEIPFYTQHTSLSTYSCKFLWLNYVKQSHIHFWNQCMCWRPMQRTAKWYEVQIMQVTFIWIGPYNNRLLNIL